MTIKEIKKSAKLNLKESYIKCASSSLLYFILIMILNYLLNIVGLKLSNNIFSLTIIQAIFGIISLVLSYGLISNILELSQGKTKSITKFIDNTILNFIKYIKITLQVMLRVLVPLFIFLLCIYYLIGTLIANINNTSFLCFYPNLLPLAIIVCLLSLAVLIYFLLKYTLTPFIYYSNTSLTSKEVVEKSAELMKGQKWNYICLILSFFGWILLTALILYILSYFADPIWLTPIVILFYTLIRPYVIQSESIFYENLGDTENLNKEKEN